MIDDEDDEGEVSVTADGATYRAHYDISNGYLHLHIDGHGSRTPVKLLPSGAEHTARVELKTFIRSRAVGS